MKHENIPNIEQCMIEGRASNVCNVKSATFNCCHCCSHCCCFVVKVGAYSKLVPVKGQYRPPYVTHHHLLEGFHSIVATTIDREATA